MNLSDLEHRRDVLRSVLAETENKIKAAEPLCFAQLIGGRAISVWETSPGSCMFCEEGVVPQKWHDHKTAYAKFVKHLEHILLELVRGKDLDANVGDIVASNQHKQTTIVRGPDCWNMYIGPNTTKSFQLVSTFAHFVKRCHIQLKEL